MKIRAFKEADTPFVIATWLNSYKSNMTGYRPSNDVFYKHHHELAMLTLKSCNIKIAHSDEDEDLIMGYVIGDTFNNILHFIYVKEHYRRFGLGKALLMDCLGDESKITISHFTNDINKLKKYFKFNYNPYTFYGVNS